MPCDRIYGKPSKHEVLVDGSPIKPENILVVNAEDNNYDATSKITNFIASTELKSKYDNIYDELNKQKTEFIKKLKSVSQSTDCESEFINCFSENPNNNFFEVLEEQISVLKDKFNKHLFRYNDVFDKKIMLRSF